MLDINTPKWPPGVFAIALKSFEKLLSENKNQYQFQQLDRTTVSLLLEKIQSEHQEGRFRISIEILYVCNIWPSKL